MTAGSASVPPDIGETTWPSKPILLPTDFSSYATPQVGLPGVSHGLRNRSVLEAADSVWLVAETVGDNLPLEWLQAKLAVKVAELEEGC
jgi:hypothetical protein